MITGVLGMVLRTITRAAVALGVATAVAMAGPSPARAAAETADLRVTSSLDKQTLRSGETFTVTVTVQNAGPATAEGVRVRSEHENCIEWTTPALADSDGYDLPAGESKVFTRTGMVAPCGHDTGRIEAFYFIHASNEPVNGYNFTTARARVLGGVAAVDFSALHAVMDASGAVRTVGGVTVAVYDEFNGLDTRVAEVRTGADGKVTVADLTPGEYHVIYTAPPGWEIVGAARADLRLDAGDRLAQEVRLIETPTTGEPTTEPTGAPGATPTTTAAAGSAGGGSGGGTLPITGVDAAAIGLAGLVLLVLGGLAFLLTRRRRYRFVTGD
jgi:LPXTG-motif cell wall-anchored protein